LEFLLFVAMDPFTALGFLIYFFLLLSSSYFFRICSYFTFIVLFTEKFSSSISYFGFCLEFLAEEVTEFAELIE